MQHFHIQKLQQRAEPDRPATRQDRVTIEGDDEGAGTRRFSLEAADNAGERIGTHGPAA